MSDEVKYGDLVKEVKEGIIIHQVNAQRVMGSGIAKHLRDKYPVVWDVYSKGIINIGPHNLGNVSYAKINENLIVANLIGQEFFGKDKQLYTCYDAVDVGILNIKNYCLTNFDNPYGVPIHIPLLMGCGLGGGDKDIVRCIIEEQLSKFNVISWVYKPA